MPVDPEIRRLVAEPEVVAAIKVIDRYFELFMEQWDNDPALAKFTAEHVVEDCWNLLKQGVLRLKDDGDDDDAPIVQLAMNPGQRARARLIGGKLYAVRQHLPRLQNAKMDRLPIQGAKAARGTPTPHKAKISRNIL